MLLENGYKRQNIGKALNKRPCVSYEYEYNEKDLHPTKDTLEAMEEVKKGKVSKPYSNIDELMRDLLD